MVNNQFGRGRGKSNAIFSHTSKCASIFRENLFDDKSSFVILIIEDLEILRWFDNGSLPEKKKKIDYSVEKQILILRTM